MVCFKRYNHRYSGDPWHLILTPVVINCLVMGLLDFQLGIRLISRKGSLCLFSFRVYDLQNKGVSFNSPVELLNGISSDFRVMLESSYGKWLDIVVGAGATFCKEVAYGFPATSFATGLKIQAFAGNLLAFYWGLMT